MNPQKESRAAPDRAEHQGSTALLQAQHIKYVAVPRSVSQCQYSQGGAQEVTAVGVWELKSNPTESQINS